MLLLVSGSALALDLNWDSRYKIFQPLILYCNSSKVISQFFDKGFDLTSFNLWLVSLRIKVTVATLSEVTISRICQL